ncbi:Troponin T [Fasciolopsis buskii]|uniref:Troponin T n=1 Tax=Fasciolopsis buskii TaxID=27845 RepID=A0A8E0RUC0_9TREM|nr:Troponin T [Fasciolopsis buski]
MSDDEHSPQHTPAPAFNEEGKSEAQIRMEQEAKRRRERAEEEWREYEEFRRGEREKAEEEIRQLQERRERRKLERAEEEKRLAELRQVEEQKRRAEEEERQRKKREEEQRKREERERKRQEWEERKNANRPNFVITKREGGELQSQPEETKKEEVTKSKEQLEAERKSIIEQRVPPLNVSGMSVEQLKAKAKELHDLLFRIEGENYDLGQRFKRQSYDMQELAERARQMNKGGKARAIPNELDERAAKFSGIPPMVVMYSQYERVKDPRSFKERRTVFAGENYVEEFQRISPKHQIVMTEEGFQVVSGAGGESHAAPAEVAAE